LKYLKTRKAEKQLPDIFECSSLEKEKGLPDTTRLILPFSLTVWENSVEE